MKDTQIYRLVPASKKYPDHWNGVNCIYKGHPLRRIIEIGENNCPDFFEDGESIDTEHLYWQEEINTQEQVLNEKNEFRKSIITLLLMAEEDYMRGSLSKKVHTAINETYLLYKTQFSTSVPVSVWISVESENEPMPMEDVLMGHDKDEWVSQGYLDHTGEWYNVFDNECPCKPTHWMPLPKKP